MEIKIKKASFKQLSKRVDLKTLIITVVLVIFGLISIYSATLASESLTHFYRQLIFAGISLAAMLSISFVPTHIIKFSSIPFYALTTLLLILVKVMGSKQYGTAGWLMFGPISLQPAELAKLSLILLVGSYLSRRGNTLASAGDIGVVALYFLVPFALINIQPDFGTAITLLVVFIGLLFWSGADTYYMVLLFSLPLLFISSLASSLHSVVLQTLVAFILLFYRKKFLVYTISLSLIIGVPVVSSKIYDELPVHQKSRISVFLDPGKDPQGIGYNVIQSMLAVGSGGITGKGLGRGEITQLKYIPMQRNDFIFSVPAEEFGMIGAGTILLLLLSLTYRVVRIAYHSKDMFGSIVCFGIATNFLFHIFINIGMVIGLMPVIGIPLPFLSSGGSALLTNMVAVGIVMNINKIR